jgi:hypothetical protein
LLIQYPWPRFRPHPEWAAFNDLKWLGLAGARWIWSNRENPPPESPHRRSYFRRKFELPANRKIRRAHLRFAGVNHVESRLNGSPSGTGWDRQTGAQFDDLAALLRPGRNIFTIWAEHRPVSKEPAGLLICLEVTFEDGGTFRLLSGDDWKCTETETPGWLALEFDDRAWAPAMVLGQPGDEPWGSIREPNPEFFGPLSAGIPGVVRVHYVPCAQSVSVRDLGPESHYQAFYFDPITGTRTPIGPVRPDAAGNWSCPPPSGLDHDWVLVLEAA